VRLYVQSQQYPYGVDGKQAVILTMLAYQSAPEGSCVHAGG
jgi:hypothetical protein